MTCKYCGTPLPADAMFCGECGRSVVVTAARIAASSRSVAKPAPVAKSPPAFLSITVPPEPAVREPAADDRAVVEPLLLQEIEFPIDLPVPASDPVPSPPAAAVAVAVAVAAASAAEHADELHDLEATRIVRGDVVGARFVLQFSTGESHAVFGSGLIGRNPVTEPGEYFDSRIAISDPGKSVSKTHLEFGQSDGQFWILDRFSGNGTVVRQPDAQAIRCDGGKRYIVPRGARIDIGEQFLVVS